MKRIHNKLLAMFGVLSLVFLLQSCATLFNSDSSRVQFSSSPSEAIVKVNGVKIGKTPCSTRLPNNGYYTIEVAKEGHNECVKQICPNILPAYIVLDLILGIAPLIIDASTQKWYALNKTKIHCELYPLSLK